MEKLTFEQLPEAVAQLLEKVNRIERLLTGSDDRRITSDRMLSADKAAEYLQVSMSMLYKMTHRNEVPFYKPGGRKLYFKVSELNEWMSKHRIKSMDEIEKEAINYVVRRKANRWK